MSRWPDKALVGFRPSPSYHRWVCLFAMVQDAHTQGMPPVRLDALGLPPAEVLFRDVEVVCDAANCDAIVMVCEAPA